MFLITWKFYELSYTMEIYGLQNVFLFAQLCSPCIFAWVFNVSSCMFLCMLGVGNIQCSKIFGHGEMYQASLRGKAYRATICMFLLYCQEVSFFQVCLRTAPSPIISSYKITKFPLFNFNGPWQLLDICICWVLTTL